MKREREPRVGNLETAAAAEILGLSPRTLRNWRVSGKGPRYSKRGARVFYAVEDLEEYDRGCRRLSTSDLPASTGRGVAERTA